jgi:diguanylate cyclase (GGDEF)-like protein/PAS domain S-box-containing protein
MRRTISGMAEPKEQAALILIVDDVATNVRVLNAAVAGLAMVQFATDGPTALALAAAHPPDVILLDIEMPGMDGYAVCKAIKASPATAHCAIIFVTGHDSAVHELASLNEGGVDFLQKPYNLAVVRARVQTHLALQARTRELMQARGDLVDLLQALPAFVAYWDREFVNLFSNDLEGVWFGVPADAMRLRPLAGVIGADHASFLLSHAKGLARGDECQFEMQVASPGGGFRYCQGALVHRPSGTSDGGFLLLLTDVSARKLAEVALHEEKEKIRVTLNSIGDAVIATDQHGMVTFINPVAEDMTGYLAVEAIGRPVELVMPLCDSESGAPSANPIRLALQENRIVGMAFDCQLIGRDGRRYAVEDSAAPILDAQGRQCGGIIVFHDVSEARAMAFKMTHLANHDALTDLPNRVLLRDRTSQAMEQAARSGQRVAMLLLDLDNFKTINSSIGHAVGDALLKQLAQRLRSELRVGDTISRQGGDEFIILLPALTEVAYADLVARKLLALVAIPFEHAGVRYDLTASIGLSLFPDDSADQDALYRHADAAMYRAKQDGKDRYRYFSSDIEDFLLARSSLERGLRHALAVGGLAMVYQPKFDARSGQIVGLEALIRWRRADGTMVSPADFIPLAEETGLIVQIGAFVLDTVCADLAALCAAGCSQKVSINISGKEFQEAGFAQRVQNALARHGVAPALLELEITEGTLMQDVVLSRANLLRLKDTGVSISIDDFGTGYSSLAYLKNFPIDVLKIDQSFVRDMLENKSDTAIISAIIHLANSLALGLVAEGVELPAQSAALIALGCPVMQGYLFARPASLAQLQNCLSAGRI